MGPGGLNYRVRDGNGCVPSGKVAGNSEEQSTVDSSQSTVKSVHDFNCKPLTIDCSLNGVASLQFEKANSELSTFNCRLFLCVQQIYGQAERAIRTSKLNALPRLHLWPIDVVVFDGPSKGSFL